MFPSCDRNFLSSISTASGNKLKKSAYVEIIIGNIYSYLAVYMGVPTLQWAFQES